ncbi:hypothetical protein PPERSA_12478 [Pseudocohnilembus persalinus]|uniref:Uncharacterized protein n=1 Tax=Pseudocohnilembus persalinus TaxID=266149 RepID=A0A0V0QNW7_PSEPJ|nr:hypothetical protein PPERSA_12478 [Pseudocohnilembus persalinus]|eukprot:KRX04031.1 hypothetical protein PPERSA_12478 [Pseudocohnilembus persalinus]
MSQLFKKLDPIVEKLHLVEFNEIKVLQLVSIKIGMGCEPAHLILISSILFGGFIVLDIASFLLTSIIGFLYPAYRSFKALQSKNEKDDKPFLIKNEALIDAKLNAAHNKINQTYNQYQQQQQQNVAE